MNIRDWKKWNNLYTTCELCVCLKTSPILWRINVKYSGTVWWVPFIRYWAKLRRVYKAHSHNIPKSETDIFVASTIIKNMRFQELCLEVTDTFIITTYSSYTQYVIILTKCEKQATPYSRAKKSWKASLFAMGIICMCIPKGVVYCESHM